MLGIPTALAGALLKNGAALAKEPVRTFLANKTLLRRVAKRTQQKAKLNGIDVSRKKLRQWLATEVAADQLAVGTSESLSAAVDSLVGCGEKENLSREQAGKVLDIMLGRFLRESETNEAIAVGTEWVGRSVEGAEARLSTQMDTMQERVLEVLGGGFGASDDAGDNLARLHPWRREKGAQLLREHRPLAELLRALINANDRGELLRQWASNPPPQLNEAPGLAWTWLGELAGDYGAIVAASHFFEQAAELGTELRAYWMARAAVCLHGTDEREQVVALLDRGADQHPLGQTVRAELENDLDGVLTALEGWHPEDQAGTVIRAIGVARVHAERDEFNTAINTLGEVVDRDRHAAGAAVELGNLLLHRSRSGLSDHAVADANRALNLAIQSRDARRAWGGNSADAVVLAITAAALLGDVERAWNLAQVEGGEATEAEATAPSVRREAAVLASLTGRHELAAELAADLDDPYVTSMNQAFEAMERDDDDEANAAWSQAFAHATSDSDRLTTAMFLAEAGANLPELEDLEERHPERVREIKIVHEVMSTKVDRISVLRARVHESTRLAIALATHYTNEGQPEKAAEVLVDAGDRHREALLLRMGADRYMRARKFPEAQAAAEKALALGGTDWPGEYDARAVLHDSMMGQGNPAGAFAQAQALVALAPDDRDARWALVGALMRRNEGEAAWRALCPDGVPIDPRGPQDARLWVQLAADHDHGPRFVPRVLAMISRWPDDEDLQGSVLAHMFFALRERDDESEEGEALREAAAAFQDRWPESRTFRAVQLGPDDDPLAPLTQELADQANAINPILDRVKAGELPLGILSALGRTYTETVVRRAAGMVRSVDPAHATASAAAVETAREHGAVVDTSALGTLATLDESLKHRLVGALRRVETSEGAYADALVAQASLGTRSTMTVGFDTSAGETRVFEISDEDADMLATRAAAIADLAASLARRSRSGPSRFERHDRRPDWLEAYELAHDGSQVFWCDDAVLSAMARNDGTATFSTVDLLRSVLTAGPADKELLEVAEGTLIANYHVDLGFNAEAMTFAAELDNWAGRGAAFALSRPTTWNDAEAAGAFLLNALDRHGSTTDGDPAELREWTAAGTLGIIRAAPDDQLASNNASILFGTIIARPWLGPDQLATVVRGVRAAITERPGVDDPLEPVLRDFYSYLVKGIDHGLASKVFMSLVRQLPEADRQTAARIVLESD